MASRSPLLGPPGVQEEGQSHIFLSKGGTSSSSSFSFISATTASHLRLSVRNVLGVYTLPRVRRGKTKVIEGGQNNVASCKKEEKKKMHT
ncbi:hypothetical protein E2C01_060180 [Portunus trituberculatus]|uniref:Uncharacterized protein n=1 Tax=Portunus trituberculatus TaxID=210409 RepID=A0A5B7H9R8_PORTR|nr:hypothetical protein [Portunus trituberculatus]